VAEAADLPATRRRARRGRAVRDRLPGEPRRVGYLYVAPAFVIYGLFVLAPLVHSAWLSFFAWDGVTQGHWVGLANYRSFVTDPAVREAYVHTVVLMLFYCVLPITLGLLLAASLSRIRIHGLTFFRTVLFLPTILSNVAVAIAWGWIYEPDGPLNQALRTVGLGSLARPWLGDFTFALPAVGVVGTWGEYGFAMVLFIAGVMKIPPSLYEAARVDGAGAVREFFVVTLPGLRNELTVVAVLTIIDALGTFDLVYVLTGGGPGTSTSVPAFQVWNRAFQTGQVGLACAIAMTLAVAIFVVSFVITRLGERRGE
jgi:raffinose/stachyose/melibiose transport system permease protein